MTTDTEKDYILSGTQYHKFLHQAEKASKESGKPVLEEFARILREAKTGGEI